MIDFEEVEHPTEFLYQHQTTGAIYRLAGFDGDIPIMQPVNLIPSAQRPMLLEAPAPILQIPRYSQSRVEEIHDEPRVVQGSVARGKIILGPDRISSITKKFSEMSLEGKIFSLFFAGVLLFFGFAVPIAAPKIAEVILPGPAKDTSKATERLQRVSQLDPGQYGPGQFQVYSPSACSPAALTMAFNSYGGKFTVGKVLSVEVELGVITADRGLINIAGIEMTANRFGFEAHPVSGLDKIVETANSGTPVVVDLLPGTAWPGGHFLVVVGGDQDHVRMADSWSTNYQTIERSRFLRWNIGPAWAISPSQYNVFQGSSTLSAEQIDKVLSDNKSPASGGGMGQRIIDLSAEYGIDPAYVMATFHHESNFGKSGMARESLSPGNLRCSSWITWGTCQRGYTFFKSWEDGFKALYILLAGSHYAGASRTVPESIIPLFAPNSDGNHEAGYISALKHNIDSLRAGKTQL